MPTSRGIDVSSYQGAQDWEALARGGLTFAFAKASEGQHSHDSRFATHVAGITAAGLIPGAYHYGWPSQDPDAEAANYVSAVHAHRVAGFVHVLDLERRTDGVNYGRRTAAQIKSWATAWISAVQAAFPHDRVGVYTSASDLAAGHMPGNAAFLWYPAYPSGAMSYADAQKRTPPAPSGRHPLFWQFTSTPGDRNIAYLSPADLRTWALGTTPQEDPLPAPIDVWAYKNKAQVKANPKLPDAYGYLQGAYAAARTLTTQVAALNATVAALTKAVGDLHSGVDTATLVAAVEKAIADAVVKVDVSVTGTDTPA